MSTAKIPVIIDTDPGVDDVVAILLALASPELDILAIVVSFGNADIDASYTNIFKLYQAISLHLAAHPNDKRRFPCYLSSRPFVARGAEGPLEGELHSAQYFHGRDGLGDITTRHPSLNVPLLSATVIDPEAFPSLQFTSKSGAELTLDLLRAHPARTITYIALGPLTNLATAVRLGGTTVGDRVGRVISMGGALDVPGNTSPVAEFNFFADPYAVKELLCPSSAPPPIPLDRFLLLPLDITTPHELPFPVYQSCVDPTLSASATSDAQAAGRSPLVHFTSSFFEHTREVMLGFGNDAMELHDIVAVWCAIQNPPLPEGQASKGGLPRVEKGWKVVQRVFDIERTGELTRGMLVVDRREDSQSAEAPGMNRTEVEAEREQHVGKVIPAQVEVEQASDALHIGAGRGVTVVVETPGPAALLEVLLERVWGVSQN
ncbi:nucleoside hydrolase [Athelia psychrophila]|uniref:Nucleoside hydrolase n=1 Tax=Athelia psychrophila TaxID=1759441 RepID=A0A166GLB6_9AGAM|nr:nucleoside hydrolase [Fibularhizoctonia sp. CBS 109695]